LIIAIEKNHEPGVKALIKAGANINIRGPKDLSPLAYAIVAERTNIAFLLIDAKADIKAYKTPNGLSILQVAALTQQYAVVEKLIKCGADCTSHTSSHGTIFSTAMESSTSLLLEAILRADRCLVNTAVCLISQRGCIKTTGEFTPDPEFADFMGSQDAMTLLQIAIAQEKRTHTEALFNAFPDV